MPPEVSVVVPTHNRSGLLAQTLHSVLWQRGVDLEVLVVDDGSTDDTAEVVAALGDPRVRLLRHATPRGVSAARNRGVAAASGRWLAFCDDDDLWAPDKLARQLAAAQQTGRSWVYVGEVHVDLGRQVVGGGPPLPPERLMARLPRANVVPGGCSGVLVRRDALGRGEGPAGSSGASRPDGGRPLHDGSWRSQEAPCSHQPRSPSLPGGRCRAPSRRAEPRHRALTAPRTTSSASAGSPVAR